MLTNSGLSSGNTYYWDRRQYTNPPVYSNAVVTHWMNSPRGFTGIIDSQKKPLEGRVWYNYAGQAVADNVDDTVLAAATITARVLDNGATQANVASYNAFGLITQSVDPVGRTTNYSYDSTNNIDLLHVSQTDGGGQDVLSTMTYNGQHEPLTTTDASGPDNHR
ncbi:MAG: RHS repeat domain-containing protein [Verrucomicrobiota bacterium]